MHLNGKQQHILAKKLLHINEHKVSKASTSHFTIKTIFLIFSKNVSPVYLKVETFYAKEYTVIPVCKQILQIPELFIIITLTLSVI